VVIETLVINESKAAWSPLFRSVEHAAFNGAESLPVPYFYKRGDLPERKKT
jgi:hypothetical protein